MKLTVVIGVLVGTLVLACSTAAPSPVEPTPNIDATVEAKLAQERVADMPLGRMGQPEDIAVGMFALRSRFGVTLTPVGQAGGE